MKRIKLCFIVNNLNVGGLEKVVINLVNYLDKDTFDIHLICLSGEGELFNTLELEREKILVLDKKSGVDISLFLKIRRFLIDHDIRIVHAHNFGPLIYSGISSKLIFFKRPLVIYSEHNQVYRQIKKGITRTKLSLSFADIILTVSSKLKEFYEMELGISKNVITVYNGIPGSAQNFEPIDKESIGLKIDTFVVGTAVVLSEQKGIIYLLDAAKKIKQEGKNIQIVIAGDGVLRAELESLSSRSGLDDIVKFIGYRSDVHALINMYDVYVLPSLWEGLPLALLEALSMGKPIIATEVGGNSEIVEDRVNGLIVPSKNSDALFEAMILMSEEEDLVAHYKDNNKTKFVNEFSLASMIENHSGIYKKYSNATE